MKVFDPDRRKSVIAMLGLAAGSISSNTLAATSAVHGPAISAGQSRDSNKRRHQLALVLGGGCHRAFAHVGVVKALEAHGIAPDLIVGTSAGSVVGALCAAGYRGPQLEEAASALTWDRIYDLSISRTGFYSGEPLRQFVNRQVGKRSIEAFPTRFAAVATDLGSGKAAIFDHGEAGLAVQASSSVPGIFHPTAIAGRMYVDGNIASPVPVSLARRLGAGIVVAVNVGFPPDQAELKNVVDIVMQAFTIATFNLTQRELALADVRIEPQLPLLNDMRMENSPTLIAAGERAGLAAVPAIKAMLAGAAHRKS